ncbi:MAG: GNAT family N-acetyltransferase [Candidatus Dactylopiibacterium carminicum]|uniref:GNAT family N-acetyltransferase n=1 Tax=Candidatus Dactylopiibacterium carminicum TaxID=857335 RepID=A0A272ETG2_9RHOO|nr:GNAT family N-acetyltransferase [Candidatus Dactylopiibacterium carminicum]KAF7599363.1 GNAT family N-acetyltransferase [Candidatus Dactylopiibacterium carminicum]PAS93372.1 MAG: GNAT family N-acetyltransferase [Candidatus Dactylopiibacterium carminicum]PAS98326.1 MAG: GNAT family N-acetyltransferase [Candidatus Dactylopiibacterium carminicum]PAS99372.1 MAG: hypothetical protein BSR46_08380 [Candidatus Dactylopiibacterium carminicum]
MTVMNIRFAEKRDLPGLLALYAELNPEDGPLDADSARLIWDRMLATGIQQVLVAETGDSLLATCSLAILPNLTRRGRSFAVIENVVTAANHRRQGFGRAVIQAALEHARTQGCYKALLLSSRKRTDAHQFYADLGFSGDSKLGYEYRFREDAADL